MGANSPNTPRLKKIAPITDKERPNPYKRKRPYPIRIQPKSIRIMYEPILLNTFMNHIKALYCYGVNGVYYRLWFILWWGHF